MMIYSHGRVSRGRDDGTYALQNQWIRLTELDKIRTFKIKLNLAL